ncbi:AAEL000916-PA [Aedes aegypti]|uniref:AAEL000916-PA n=1 Tax=Aedes aegypti TaxID=7159 RepID=Q17MU5_AEDAE|nr:AAEL000916-PA [Aedes aegypti]
MFKVTLLIASLAYASAGYAGLDHSYAAPVAAHYSSAPSVSYSTFSRSHAPSLGHGYTHAAPVLAAPTQVYSTPLTKTYTHGYNYAPALSYGHGYAPALSHNSYGYSGYAAPLTTKTVAIAQPQLYHQNSYATHAAPVLAHHGYNYGGSHLLGCNNHHGHYAY